MATNPYMSQKVRGEQSLYEDLIVESIKFYGQDIYYLPREIIEKEEIFLDTIHSQFADAYKVEVYIENTDGFDGEGDIFTKFGIELRDQATFVISRRRWQQTVGDFLDEEAQYRPREGDVIFLPMSQSLFEVKKVETESPFYQLSQLPLFRIQAELFEFSDEDFDTGIDAIDVVEQEHAFQYHIQMAEPESDQGGFYDVGTYVYQTFDDFELEGEVSDWNSETKILSIAHTGADDGNLHVWSTDRVITSETGATFMPLTVSEDISKLDSMAQNEVFDDFSDDFLDFSEGNPFGDTN